MIPWLRVGLRNWAEGEWVGDATRAAVWRQHPWHTRLLQATCICVWHFLTRASPIPSEKLSTSLGSIARRSLLKRRLLSSKGRSGRRHAWAPNCNRSSCTLPPVDGAGPHPPFNASFNTSSSILRSNNKRRRKGSKVKATFEMKRISRCCLLNKE